MSTCIVRQTSVQLPPIVGSQQYQYPINYQSRMAAMSYRKRLYSEQNHCSTYFVKHLDDEDKLNKRTKKGDFGHESIHTDQRHAIHHSVLSLFEKTRHCRSAPGHLLRRKSFTHLPSTYISNAITSHTCITSLSTLTKRKKTKPIETNMLAFQQTANLVINDEVNTDNNSIYITCSQLSAYISNSDELVLVIDCGSPLRHTERRIQNSLLLNVNDKISRKRLSTRGLKTFLEATQLNRFNNSQIIVLYDDTIRPSTLCANASITSQLSPAMKCIYDEIKRYDSNKQIYILQSTFDEFLQLYPSHCYLSTSTDEDLLLETMTEPETQADIDLCQISQIIPGLFLGNSRDAEDLNVLRGNQIRTIVNISTSIPCFHENDKTIEYIPVPCHDSPNQNILQYFESIFEVIHARLSSNQNILVHCQGGVSRSPSFVIGYLMKYHSKTFEQAYEIVKKQRKIVNPNLNFISQLTQYQQMLNCV